MTTVIDHAIAIPTRPNTVWEILRDISKNPTWHPDSQGVQFLTTMKTGRGLRWRNTTKGNKEQVFEITAWYEGLGYEYRIVDGSIYPNNRGQIRLQEAPEGTIVQWIFSYDVQGFLSGLRNKLSMRGHADELIKQGLRNIYAVVKEAKTDEILDPESSKAYLKEAPNVEERASYQPRYPSKASSQELPAVGIEESARFKAPAQSEKPSQAIASIQQIPEPPISDEDTRPNPTIQETGAVPQVELHEPDFLKAMPDKAHPLPMIEDSAKSSAPTPVEEETVAAPGTPPIGETDTVAVEDLEPETRPLEKDGVATVEPLTPGQDISKLDTATVSVFELFGIEKPSETEKVKTLPEKLTSEKIPTIQAVPIIEPPKSFMDSTPIIPDVQPEVPKRRRGLRATMRSHFTNLRVPESEE